MSGTAGAPAVASIDGSLLVTFDYNDTVAGDPALVWVIIHDNPIIAWSLTEPIAPIIIGSMPLPAPDTSPIKSPPWGQYVGGTLYIPDVARGNATAMFNAIAFNNGANRKLYANFINSDLASAWRQWAENNPANALSSPPNV